MNTTLHVFESLESRMLLTGLNTPVLLQRDVTIEYRADNDSNDIAFVTFSNNNTGTPNTHYKVYWSASKTVLLEDAAHTLVDPADIGNNEQQASQTLPAGQQYFYHVRAINGSDVSDPSESFAALGAKDFSVQMSAAPADGGGIKLTWDQLAATNGLYPAAWSYSIWRKSRGETSWGSARITGIAQNTLTWTDENAQSGQRYEYKIERTVQFTGDGLQRQYGYVYAGYDIPFANTQTTRTALLVIDANAINETLFGVYARELMSKIDRLKLDLIAEGWKVIEATQSGISRGVARDTNDDGLDASQALTLKGIINNVYDQNGGLDSIFLIGHVPVPYSGVYRPITGQPPDGHADHPGAWPADIYYGIGLQGSGDPDAGWTINLEDDQPSARRQNNNGHSDAKFDNNVIPGGVQVPVGRIDFANLPAMKFTIVPLPSDAEAEVRLLSRYLDKDHAWRTGITTVLRRALIDDNGGDSGVSTSWSTYAPLVGRDQVVNRNWEDELHTQGYLFATGNGSGSNEIVYGVTDVTKYNSPVPGRDHTAVFNQLGGSYFGDWNAFNPNKGTDSGSNILRSVLATNGFALSTAYSLRASWFYHTLGLGETIGEASMLSQNNRPAQPTYTVPVNTLTGNGVGSGYPSFNLLGDPTITAFVVKPATNVQEAINLADGSVTLTWDAPTNETVSRYNIYRASSVDAAFSYVGQRTTLSFTDASPQGQYVYLVRAIKLETTASGTYENASAGVFATTVILNGKTSTDAIQLRRYTSGSASPIGVWTSSTFNTGNPDYVLDARTTASIVVNGNAGDDLLMLDYRGVGNPVPSGGLTYAGGTGANTLMVIGSASTTVPDVFTFAASSITGNVSGASATTVSYSNLNTIWFNGVLGADQLTVNGGTTVTLSSALPELIAESTSGVVYHFGSVAISGINTKVALPVTNGDQLVEIDVNSGNIGLSIASGGVLDLADNDMLLHTPNATNAYGTIKNYITSARNAGAWNGSGVTSSVAGSANPANKMLGIVTGAEYASIFATQFHGVTIASSDVLVKFTYYGDTDFNGLINFDDYSRTDAGFNNNRTGWFNGDFDLNNVVNFDDYSLIDLAFNTQNNVVLTGGPGGGNALLVQIAQMPHFTEEFMWYFIAWNAARGTYYTPEDFFPDGVPW